MLRALLIAIALPLAAHAQAQAQEEDEHLTEADGLRVLHAWTNAGTGDVAQVYLEIENTGEAPIELTGAHAGEARATIVASAIAASGGVPETLDALLLPAGVETVLEPGGLHLRLAGVEAPRDEGDEMDLTLTFADLGEVEVHVRVEAADATQHSHAGHSH